MAGRSITPDAPGAQIPPWLPSIPPLESGDRLTRVEFEQRYDAMPWIKKAELIEGVVYVASPVRMNVHARPHAAVVTWAGVYAASTPGILVADNGTLRLDDENEPQPDVMLSIDPARGGASRVGPDDYAEGAPELIIEIAASSASYDLGDKREVYRRTGVREYIVWQIYDQRIDWWELHEGVYVPLAPDDQGVVASRVFPGLRLDRAAMLAGRMADVLAELRCGIETTEHATFVQALEGQR
jgi:Uma2 family endonuclease